MIAFASKWIQHVQCLYTREWLDLGAAISKRKSRVSARMVSNHLIDWLTDFFEQKNLDEQV